MKALPHFPVGSLVVLHFPRYAHSIEHKGELVKIMSEPEVITINNSPVRVQFYDRPRSAGIDHLPCYDSPHAFTYPKEIASIFKNMGISYIESLYESEPN